MVPSGTTGLRLVELMGLPGAGKSTVYRALLDSDPRVIPMPLLKHQPYAAGLARHLAGSVATLARRGALSREWNKELLVMMAYVRALPPVLTGPRAPDGDVLVFDQGPIYTLMRPIMRDRRLRAWWEASLSRWRDLLDAVVWLDAPDAVLAERIDTRGSGHRLKGVERDAALAGIAADRAVYEATLARLEGGPRLLRYDTSAQAPDAVVADVLDRIRA